MAIVEGKVVGAYDDEAPAGRAVVAELARWAQTITLLVGEDTGLASDDWLAEARAAAPGVEVRVVDGGQPVYSLMACAEPAAPAPARPRGAPLTAETTALVFDSTVDLADPSARHPNWSMVPLTVSFGAETFRDYVDIGPEEFYRRLRTAPEPPRTAAPSPGAWQNAFEQLDGFARVLVLPVSSKLSASAQSAELAARELDPDARRITVLQTASASLGTLVLAEGLQRLLVRGLPENEVMLWFEAARERLGVIFSVDTLEYLRRGGRIGRAQALVGGVLRMRPIMTLQDGEVAPLQRVRGAARAQLAFERFLADHATGSQVHTAIVHADAPDAARRLEEMVHRTVPRAVVDHVGELGAVVGTHGGPGTLGLAVLSEP
jgi:DegV family protein with EDD domain